MHIDARELENGSLIEGDICIVGAGAAGISMALDWAGRSERVILLEAGGFEYEAQMQELYRGDQNAGGAEPLDQGDDPGSGAGAGCETCPVGKIGLDGTDDDREAASERIRLAGEEQAQGPGEAQDPLTDGHFGKHVIDQVRWRFDHASCATRRAEAPALARESYEVLMTAAVAPVRFESHPLRHSLLSS